MRMTIATLQTTLLHSLPSALRNPKESTALARVFNSSYKIPLQLACVNKARQKKKNLFHKAPVKSMASSGSEPKGDAPGAVVGPGVSGKSEREKMLAGELYSPLQNPELKTLHQRAVKVVNEFNETPLDEEEKRAELMKVGLL